MSALNEQKKQRPRFLDLTVIRLPLAGYASILHRVSGAGLFLMLPLLIWLLELSLSATPDSLALFEKITGSVLVRLVLLGLIWAFLHHFCMGLRILLIDIHVGVEKQQARSSAMAVMVVSLSLTLAFGLKLFGVY
ncbi:succinate dehydrogenase [Rugosibacter aromaticivorans]|uniref:Succinate dehydrogenase cytochrome b556 subunit n=1 Tax=Rugosibacter aromaticivorans TaxID=1565605 RepID=A0A0C5IYP7_9PROT|nr:succinate dehydrogenase, cytochrome b556 subunit [Rugosibacter aromaticivorans]AJP47877.1 succinate dehydrogenase [Rugosibacter aromaticivorans]TBR15013.1 MAG: succinate dehydrogenase, cytochrome b556 subunit [Rugosibacter sp.]